MGVDNDILGIADISQTDVRFISVELGGGDDSVLVQGRQIAETAKKLHG